METKTKTIKDLNIGDYATDGEIISEVKQIPTGEKYYALLGYMGELDYIEASELFEVDDMDVDHLEGKM